MSYRDDYDDDESGQERLIPLSPGSHRAPREVDRGDPTKYWSIIIVGILTMAYSTFEIYIAIYQDSLALLSDGFHNLSDVIALIIAFYAMWKSAESRTQTMTYGWKRTEVLGAVMNACFLLALCMYIILEAIPKFITPVPILADWWFIGTAGAGLVINFVATIIFSATGTHAHSHAGGGGHSHSHGGGHSHKEKKHKHGHDEKEKHGHKHGHKDKDKKEKHGHGDEEKHGHKHGHKDKEHKDKEHKHGHKEKEHKHGHKHGHDDHDSHSDDDHGHGHGGKEKVDMNMQAVFLHYLGDAISSLFVLAAGLIIHFLPDQRWVLYVDPASSLLIVALIIGSIIPLLKGCSNILLQQAPPEIDCTALQLDLEKVDGIRGIHDLHVWQLVDGVTIASLHVSVWECDVESFTQVANRCKKVLHKYDIHSSTLQPEFISRAGGSTLEVCSANCAKDCDEDWCCKDEHLNIVELDTFGSAI